MLEAVPETPLPETREEYWQAVWDYRRREFDFFASNVALGRVLILSLGNNEPETEEHVEEICPPLVRIIRRQKALIRRGQELGAIRDDLSVDVILELMRTVDRALCVRFFGRNAEEMERLSPGELEKRSRSYTCLFQDLIYRMLTPGFSLDWQSFEEESIDVEKIAVGA